MASLSRKNIKKLKIAICNASKVREAVSVLVFYLVHIFQFDDVDVHRYSGMTFGDDAVCDRFLKYYKVCFF